VCAEAHPGGAGGLAIWTAQLDLEPGLGVVRQEDVRLGPRGGIGPGNRRGRDREAGRKEVGREGGRERRGSERGIGGSEVREPQGSGSYPAIIYIHISIYLYLYLYLHTHTHTHTHIYISTSIYLSIYISTYLPV
jgi:hypothetical protein